MRKRTKMRIFVLCKRTKMNRAQLQAIILDQKESFEKRKELIDRNIDLDAYISGSQIIVVSGVRRCGKSSLLRIIRNKMMLKEDEYCYINFDDERLIPYAGIMDDIYALHLEIYRTKPVFFFDEIQTIEGWERFLNRMYEDDHKIFVTGSNARLLSSEISTSLTGRNKVIELYPFSFEEFLRFKNRRFSKNLSTKETALLRSYFTEYMEYGGFPLVLKDNDKSIINSWFQDILYRDIMARYRIQQMDEIKQMALFLLSNTAKLFSYKTIQSVSDIKSTSTVKQYLQYFEQSFVFFYLKKFDFSVKKQIMNSRKLYSIDNLLSAKMGFRVSNDTGRMIENMVFLELRRRGKEVYYYSEKKECDFIIKEGIKPVEAIQVVHELTEENYSRELAGLQEAMEKLEIETGRILYFGSTINIDEKEMKINFEPVYWWLLGS